MEDWVKAVVACHTEEDADRVFNDILEQNVLVESARNRWSPREAERILRENIGYIGGYYDRETQLRLYKLFKTEHPIFGIEEPTFEQALWAGVRISQEMLSGGRTLSIEEHERMMRFTKDLKRWR